MFQQDLSTCGFWFIWSTWASRVQLLYQDCVIWPAQMLVLVKSPLTIQVPPIGKVELGKATKAKIIALLWDSPACPGCSHLKKLVLRPLKIPTNLFTLSCFFFFFFFDTLRHTLFISWFLECEGVCKLLVSSRSWVTSAQRCGKLSEFCFVFFYFIRENSVEPQTHILILVFIIIMQITLLMNSWNECFWGKKPLLLLLLLLICRDVSKCLCISHSQSLYIQIKEQIWSDW